MWMLGLLSFVIATASVFYLGATAFGAMGSTLGDSGGGAYVPGWIGLVVAAALFIVWIA